MLGFCACCFCILWLNGERPPRACSPAPMGEGEPSELFPLRRFSSISLFLFLLRLRLSLDSSDSQPDELLELGSR